MAENKSLSIFKSIVPDIEADPELTPSRFIKKYWGLFEKKYPASESRGTVFELMLAAVFCRSGLLPIYRGAKVAFVPGIIYDFVLYTKENGPVVFSAKTSLRERWKQADLEAVMLKNVHRKAKTYLITLDAIAAQTRKNREEETVGIDQYVLADQKEFDEIISDLKELHLCEAPEIKAIESGTLITAENFKTHFN